MAFLIDIGTGIVGKLVELTVAPVGRQVDYLIYYNQNIKNLEDQLNVLVAASLDVEHRVGKEKKNVRLVGARVNKWQTDVQKITGEAKEILNEEYKEKMKCLYGLCPNLVLRHQLSRKSTKLVPSIAYLCETNPEKDLSTFAHDTTLQDVPTKDYEAIGSRTFVVNQIMDLLRNCPNFNMIGVGGLGGVGKTTLVKEVSRQAKTLFDYVVMILDVKQDPSIERIQKEIAEKLELELHDETTEGRARRLYSRIKEQKTLIILDVE